VKTSVLIRRLILLLAILISGGLYIFSRELIAALILILCFFQKGAKTNFHKEINPAIFLLACVSILYAFRPDSFTYISFVTRYVVFIISLFVFNHYVKLPVSVFQTDLFVLLRLMAYQAILTFILAIIVPSFFIDTNYLDASYRTIFYIFTCHIMKDDISILPRPDGFFWEPGVFQLYLNLYLYLCLFIFKNKWQSIIAVIALLTTQSTTGLILCLIIIGYYVLTESINKGTLASRVIKIFAGIIILIPFVYFASGNLEDKLYGEGRGSAWAREYDLKTGLNVIEAYPFIGIGFDYTHYYKISQTLGYKDTFLDYENILDRGNSNSIIFLFYSVGIPLSIIFMIGLFNQAFFKHKLLVASILIISCLSESLLFTPFFLLFIYNGLASLVFKRTKKVIAV
jgi:hypothetical protein